MTNEEILEKLLYLSFKEEIDLEFIQDRINLLEQYPSIVFHPCQMFGVRNFYYINVWSHILYENTKYNDNHSTYTHASWLTRKNNNHKITKLKLDYSPNFNKITNKFINENSAISISSDECGLSNYKFYSSDYCFLDKNDAIKFKNRN